MAANKIEDDNTVWERIKRNLETIDNSFVLVGITEKKGAQLHPGNPLRDAGVPDDAPNVAEIMFFHEFGFRLTNGQRVPQRSVIRATTDELAGAIKRKKEKLLGRVMDGTISTKKGLDSLGMFVAEQMKNKIKQGPFAPNAPSVQQRKGANKPLIDSTLLLRSFGWETKIKR